MKKAQVTLFVIIAIIIVVSEVLVLYSGNILQKFREAGMPDQVKSAKNIIDECVEDSSKAALAVVSLQGGYADRPEEYISHDLAEIGYWYIDRKDATPALIDIEEELSLTTCRLMDVCIDLEATIGECTAKTTIKTNEILIDINYPITMDIADETYTLQDFSTKLDARLGKIYNAGKEIVAEQVTHPDELCLTCLADVGAENDIFVSVGSEGSEYIVGITDENSEVFDEPFEFQFAMRLK